MQTYSLASIVEPVLNMEEGTLFQEIAKDPEKFNEDIVRSGLTDVPFILGQDWLQAGSDAVMLTKGSPIWKSIRGVSRIISNATGVPNDPEISATMELNQYLVGEITGHVETIKRSILASRTNGGIYSNNKINMTAIVESLDAIIEYCLSSPAILTKFFAEIKKKRPKDRDSVLENSINATFISMFILNDQDAGVTKEDFVEIGCCAMFRDISRILYPGRDGKDDTKAHPAESARIVKEFDLPDSVGHMIETHHDIDYGGQRVS